MKRWSPPVLAALTLVYLAPAASGAAKRTRTPTPTPSAAATPGPATTAAPRPAELIPNPPFVGTPAAGEKPHVEILRLEESGATEEALLAKVRQDGRAYSLTTSEIQTLRAAGVSGKVIEAMLKSGRAPSTPVPKTPAPAATPR